MKKNKTKKKKIVLNKEKVRDLTVPEKDLEDVGGGWVPPQISAGCHSTISTI